MLGSLQPSLLLLDASSKQSALWRCQPQMLLAICTDELHIPPYKLSKHEALLDATSTHQQKHT